jgi:mannose/fructose-specific phosphotransferase system component IIA
LVFEQAKPHIENAVVVFDGSGSRPFKRQLATFLRQLMNEEQIQRIRKVKMQDSKTNNLIQLVDMICGTVYHAMKNSSGEMSDFRRLIAHRELSAQIWPQAMR